MATLRENALRIRDAKEKIRQSIINKGVDVEEDVKIEEYSLAIDSISTGPETGTYSIEVYIRVDNELIGEGVNFNVIGTDGTSTAATSRSGGYLFLTLNYNVGYDVQPAEEDKYFAESHILIYHTKDEGDYFATDYYFTTAGGSEEWKLTDANYVAYYNKSAIENINNIVKYIDFDSINGIEYFYTAGTSVNSYGSLNANDAKELLSKITHVTKLRNSFTGLYTIPEDITIDVNLPNCSDLAGSFNSLARYSGEGQITFDLHGSTGKISSWNIFSTYSAWHPAVKGILNINMDRLWSNSGFKGNSQITRFTFDGSFGGLSTVATATLDISTWTSLTTEAFLETMQTISVNTNGNTRIFKLPAALYDSLTDEILDLADEKGYTLSS